MYGPACMVTGANSVLWYLSCCVSLCACCTLTSCRGQGQPDCQETASPPLSGLQSPCLLWLPLPHSVADICVSHAPIPVHWRLSLGQLVCAYTCAWQCVGSAFRTLLLCFHHASLPKSSHHVQPQYHWIFYVCLACYAAGWGWSWCFWQLPTLDWVWRYCLGSSHCGYFRGVYASIWFMHDWPTHSVYRSLMQSTGHLHCTVKCWRV